MVIKTMNDRSWLDVGWTAARAPTSASQSDVLAAGGDRSQQSAESSPKLGIKHRIDDRIQKAVDDER